MNKQDIENALHELRSNQMDVISAEEYAKLPTMDDVWRIEALPVEERAAAINEIRERFNPTMPIVATHASVIGPIPQMDMSKIEARVLAKMIELEGQGIVSRNEDDTWNILDKPAFDKVMGLHSENVALNYTQRRKVEKLKKKQHRLQKRINRSRHK